MCECTYVGRDEQTQILLELTPQGGQLKTDRQERQCALRINIKHTKGQSQHSSYRSYNIRTKRGSRRWKQRVFRDFVSGFHVLCLEKMLRDGAELI